MSINEITKKNGSKINGTEKLVETAKFLLESGISVLPLGHIPTKLKAERGEINEYNPKTPKGLGSWKEYETTRMAPSSVENKFKDAEGIGAICGKVSGGLYCIDVDLKYDVTGTLEDRLKEAIAKELGPNFLDQFVVQKTVNNGLHYPFFYPAGHEVPDSPVLAARADGKPLIETRGEGGYFCIEPTEGYYFEDGELTDIPRLPITEIEKLLKVCRYFDERVEIKKAPAKDTKPYKGQGKTPWDDFNEKNYGPDLLLEKGWTITRENNEWIDLLRPGGTGQKSAGWNKEKEFLKVFSTSTDFDTERGIVYTSYGIYTVLEHGKDWSKAAKKLYSEGYGDRKKRSAPGVKAVPIFDLLTEYFSSNLSFFAYDEGLMRYVDTRTWEIIPERKINTYYVDFSKATNTKNKQAFIDFISSDHLQEVNLLQEKIKSMQKDTGSETGYIQRLYNCLPLKAGVYPDNFTETIFKKWIIGMVGRVLGGKENPLMLVFVGAVNTGKTYFFRNLLPEELSLFKSEELPDDKDGLAILAENLLYFNDEMDKQSRAEANRFRAIVSKDEVTYRPPYAKTAVKRRRLSTFAGSSNDLAVISDFANNRRIIPLEFDGMLSMEFDGIDKRKVIGEAATLYKNGFDYAITREEINMLLNYAGEYKEDSVEIALIQQYFEAPENTYGPGVHHKNGNEIYLDLAFFAKKKGVRITPRKITQALNALGYKSQNLRVNKKQKKGYQVKWKLSSMDEFSVSDNGIPYANY